MGTVQRIQRVRPPRRRVRRWAVAPLRSRPCCSGEWRNRQTRWLQVPVTARSWGFKSPLAHRTLSDDGWLIAELADEERVLLGDELDRLLVVVGRVRRMPGRVGPLAVQAGPLLLGEVVAGRHQHPGDVV